MIHPLLSILALSPGRHTWLIVLYVVLCLLVAGLVKWWTDRE
jgi:hypothetical protein